MGPLLPIRVIRRGACCLGRLLAGSGWVAAGLSGPLPVSPAIPPVHAPGGGYGGLGAGPVGVVRDRAGPARSDEQQQVQVQADEQVQHPGPPIGLGRTDAGIVDRPDPTGATRHGPAPAGPSLRPCQQPASPSPCHAWSSLPHAPPPPERLCRRPRPPPRQSPSRRRRQRRRDLPACAPPPPRLPMSPHRARRGPRQRARGHPPLPRPAPRDHRHPRRRRRRGTCTTRTAQPHGRPGPRRYTAASPGTGPDWTATETASPAKGRR
jgi:hypothetical protein